MNRNKYSLIKDIFKNRLEYIVTGENRHDFSIFFDIPSPWLTVSPPFPGRILGSVMPWMPSGSQGQCDGRRLKDS